MYRLVLTAFLSVLLVAPPSRAQPAAPAALPAPVAPPPAVARSMPTAQPVLTTVPPPRDIAWASGPLRLEIDATDVARRIIKVRQTIPVATGGPLTLLFPEWLPGNHAPRGQIEKLAGLGFTADGQPLAWRRDPLDVHAFHLSVPAGTAAVVASFQYLAPTQPAHGRVVMTDTLLNLQWNSVSLYPAGFYTRRIPIEASVTLPEGWTAATALAGTQSGNVVHYEATDYETLVDTPIYAGRHRRLIDLGHDVTLGVFADSPDELQASPEQIAIHRRMVAETVALFGARHFDRYTFLLSISETLGRIGLEHHRVSENGVVPGYFTRWADALGDRDLLAHEFVHSWNGKFRRPELLWTPDFSTPMQNDLLWVYEGQTQFWGYVLAARSGMLSTAEALDAFAAIAGRLEHTKGRQWRPLADTTLDPIMAARRPKSWSSWQRTEDYYNEGLMIWLEADAIIRRETDGARSLDDFARAFFGMNDGDWGVLTYDRQAVVDALNAVLPFDWAGFLRARVNETSRQAPTGGLALGGYRLAYGPEPNRLIAREEAVGRFVDQSYGVGLIVAQDGTVNSVVWDSPAFAAGISSGERIVAVNGTDFTPEAFRAALAATADRRTPLSLILRQEKRYRTIPLDYSGGLRYPRLDKTGEGQASLDRLLTARTIGAPVN
jgi:predicted metalloprotease with PDZ domain